MTSKQDDQRIAPSDDQIADLKKAIADLAEGKRVPLDIDAMASGTHDYELSAASLQNAVDTPLPSQRILSRYKWVLVAGAFGMVVGFLSSALVSGRLL
jgi:hypothetical protein